MRRLAYIPARSGSKGIPKNNIRPLCGRPLLGWMVEAAQKTGLFDRVMVSTDTEEFADVARSCGAWVPFLRDSEVAKDTTTSIETVCSDKMRLESIHETFDVFCLLQPTSPLCRMQDIIGAINLFERVHAGVVSLVRSKVRPTFLRVLEPDGRTKPLLETRKILRRQDEPYCYELNGAIYVNSWDEVNCELKFGYNPYGYIMDDISSIDVDLQEDFELAERYLQERLKDGDTNYCMVR